MEGTPLGNSSMMMPDAWVLTGSNLFKRTVKLV
jgi:hypothetical protein